MVADGAEADLEGAGDFVLGLVFFEQGKNFRAKVSGMPDERLERKRKFGRLRTLRHKDQGILDEFKDWARP